MQSVLVCRTTSIQLNLSVNQVNDFFYISFTLVIVALFNVIFIILLIHEPPYLHSGGLVERLSYELSHGILKLQITAPGSMSYFSFKPNLPHKTGEVVNHTYWGTSTCFL